MLIVELAKEWGGVASLMAVVSGLAVGKYQLGQAVADVKDLKKQRLDDIEHKATQTAALNHLKEGIAGIRRSIDIMTEREYKALKEAAENSRS